MASFPRVTLQGAGLLVVSGVTSLTEEVKSESGEWDLADSVVQIAPGRTRFSPAAFVFLRRDNQRRERNRKEADKNIQDREGPHLLCGI